MLIPSRFVSLLLSHCYSFCCALSLPHRQNCKQTPFFPTHYINTLTTLLREKTNSKRSNLLQLSHFRVIVPFLEWESAQTICFCGLCPAEVCSDDWEEPGAWIGPLLACLSAQREEDSNHFLNNTGLHSHGWAEREGGGGGSLEVSAQIYTERKLTQRLVWFYWYTPLAWRQLKQYINLTKMLWRDYVEQKPWVRWRVLDRADGVFGARDPVIWV